MSTLTGTKISELQPKMTRGQRLWLRLRELRDAAPASIERAKLVTDSYKETEGLPIQIRRAKAFERILTEIPIYIDDDQLLVGDWGSRPMSAEWIPEGSGVTWVLREFESGELLRAFSKEEAGTVREIYEYWKDRSTRESIEKYMGEEHLADRANKSEEGDWVYVVFKEMSGGKSWYAPDWERALKKGLSGLLADVVEELHVTPSLDTASQNKVYFLEALTIILKAGIQYSKRYAALAREMAKDAEGHRKAELEEIADICDWVPENPARTFREALQSMWFCDCMLFWDVGSHTRAAPGRVDQYFYPYYKRDLDEGRITDEDVIELLECFRVKVSAGRQFSSRILSRSSAGEALFINCTLGGVTPEGRDAVNRLSYLWLEAARRCQTPHPTLSIRYHDNISADFAMKAAELTAVGLGYPAWFGDRTSIDYVMAKMGATFEEARNYCLAGCVLTVVPGKTPSTWPVIISMPKVLEITMNNGIDPRSGRQYGLKLGTLEDFGTYEELYEAYKKQFTFFMKEAAEGSRSVRLLQADKVPQLFASVLFDDCIKRGQDPVGGGCHYQQGAMYLLPIGIIDVADSMAALKQCIYDKGLISKEELMESLQANFVGKESVRRILLAAPKFGNDDDYVDNIAAELYSWLCNMLDEIDACFGAKYVCAPHTISDHGPAGLKVGALPSGRLRGVALADGGVSPSQGLDTHGPTAVINSASKIDHTPIYGTLLNMKFSPGVLKTKEDLTKFLALIDTYLVDYGGKHIQFNVIDSKTLLDAQKHPENYRNLVIRVAGYSALWVELTKEIQDEIIKRTEHQL